MEFRQLVAGGAAFRGFFVEHGGDGGRAAPGAQFLYLNDEFIRSFAYAQLIAGGDTVSRFDAIAVEVNFAADYSLDRQGPGFEEAGGP